MYICDYGSKARMKEDNTVQGKPQTDYNNFYLIKLRKHLQAAVEFS